ncbi:clarin-3-like [Scleropages formosus]|uniref:Clarin 3 n=1 Tax=Scleropages formosus TaxID=113540 RepID=A0A0P7XEU5_SCLFO|nr:clarin-3 [Scleropages formosus]KPP73997.1 clarin-3-like [Scleropages formosus]
MPSTTKILHFLAVTLASAIAAGMLGYGMAATWAVSTMGCEQNKTNIYNGTAEVTLGLFRLEITRRCPFGAGKGHGAFEKLQAIGGIPIILHGLVVAFLVFSLVGTAGSILVSLYNSVSNPYQTHLGPVGVFTCSSIGVIFCFLALILFVVNVYATDMFESLVMSEQIVNLEPAEVTMEIGFFFLIPFLVMSLLAILVVFLYQHVAYTHQREQQRPTEDAPKEIMMY